MAPDFRIPATRLVSLLLFFAGLCQAFYIPGYSIRSYEDDENIPLLVNKVYSDNTQLQYAYFDLPFVCPPSGHRPPGSLLGSGRSVSLNLGEVLRGDRIMTSDFEINMGQDIECQYLCDRVVGRKDLLWAQELIEDGYITEWILDNLPGATSFVTVDRKRKYYAAGFKMGYKDFDVSTAKPQYFLHNHYTMVVRWRKAPGRAGNYGAKVVVGFEVFPKSITGGHRNETGCPLEVSGEQDPLELWIPPNSTDLTQLYPDSSYVPEQVIDLNDGATMVIPYTYSVYFREENDIEWSHRWDLYFSDQGDSSWTHWLAIVNSVIISCILGAVCIVIWGRTTQGDVKGRGDGALEEARTRSRKGGSGEKKRTGAGLLDKIAENSPDDDLSSDDEALEDITGWKLLHADVFRAPQYGGLLAPLVGSGMQLVFMLAGLLLLSALGILNPSWRGGFGSVGIGLFIFAGGFSGYFSSRVYKTFGGSNWRKNTLMTAILVPGLIFSLLFVFNLFVWAQASSTAIPFTTLLALAFLWLTIQVPLVYLGSYIGFFNAPVWEPPTRVSPIPRQIPAGHWYTRNSVAMAVVSGLVPFAVLFIELLFVMKSLWQDKSGYYYVFGYLSIVSALLAITIAEVTIITTYLQLCAENYHWWWQSFMTGGSLAIWIFVYSVWYLWTRLHVEGFVSTMLYLFYSALGCGVLGLAGATLGVCVAWAWVRRIYGGVKVD